MTNLYRTEAGARLVQQEYRHLLERWPAPNRQLRVSTRYGETFVVACGGDDAPPLLLFHGGGTTSAMWLDSAAPWAAHFRVYGVDLIGEPGFSAPSRPPLTSDAYALWLDDVLTSLSLARVSIVGASLGAWLALDYATRRPEHVDRLVLLGPMGVGRVRTSFLFTTLPLLLLGDWGRRRALRKIVGLVPPDASFDDQRLLSLVQAHFRARMAPLPIVPDEALKRLTMPVMAIVGGRDAIVDSDETKRRLELGLAHADVRLLAEAGHRIFNASAATLEFLRWPLPRDSGAPLARSAAPSGGLHA